MTPRRALKTAHHPLMTPIHIRSKTFFGRRTALASLALLLLTLSLVLIMGEKEPLREVLPPKALQAIPKNLSGLTWNAETGTLFAVTNGPEYAYELSLEGDVLRSIRLRGFKDTEGITHIEGTLFAVVEERKGILSLFHIPAGATEIDHDGVSRLELGKTRKKNKGFETVSYDPATRTLYTMREGKPFVRLAIPLDDQFRPGEIRTSPLPGLRVKDVASIVSDTDGTLWVLSEASSRIVQLDRDGRELRSFRLPIDTKTFQPEGITLGPAGKIILAGEPNILAIYETP